ncbi:MAG: hydroxymethylglutaryl-CoA lyase [Deltaproteobacteria bacterium]|nr:hydroxymethylglutaryl-CoA lyase [Deltaproteobacteria bacterium]
MDMETSSQLVKPVPAVNTREVFCRAFPKHVTLIEVGPRDGFQFEEKIVLTALKLEIIMRLVEAGFKHIQVASFVHPGKVPQMADAEILLSALSGIPGIAFSALVLNMAGVERAISSKLAHIEVSISASNRHSLNNTGMSADAALKMGLKMVALSKEHGMHVRAGIQCAFGSGYDEVISEDRIAAMAKDLVTAGADMLCLADTTGMATPLTVHQVLCSVRPVAGNLPIIMHLHDTRGLGLANVMAAMSCGVSHFDTALAGMGGCPFIQGAAGNIATEDTLYLLSSLHIETGLNLSKIAACSRDLEVFFGKCFPGKLYRHCD